MTELERVLMGSSDVPNTVAEAPRLRRELAELRRALAEAKERHVDDLQALWAEQAQSEGLEKALAEARVEVGELRGALREVVAFRYLCQSSREPVGECGCSGCVEVRRVLEGISEP